MARFLMMTAPYPGHLAPCIPISRKLIERGHDVVWITGREYEEKVKATGARFEPLPKEHDPDNYYTEWGERYCRECERMNDGRQI